jgi:hypothetical protein
MNCKKKRQPTPRALDKCGALPALLETLPQRRVLRLAVFPANSPARR